MDDEHKQKPKNGPVIVECDSDEEKKINKKKKTVKKPSSSGGKVVSKRGNRQLVVRQPQQPAVLNNGYGFGQQHQQMLLYSNGIGLQPPAVQPIYQQQSLQIAAPKTDDFQMITSQFNQSGMQIVEI